MKRIRAAATGRSGRNAAAGLAVAVAACGFAQAPPDGDAAIVAALHPDTIRVAPGEAFELALRVDVAGRPFNAYDAVVSFDTTLLAHEPPASPREGEGALMTGACGNTFHRLGARGDSVTVSHVTLCGGVALTGPGTLHRFRFRALDQTGATEVRLRRVQFYDAGLFVNPSRARDAVVVVTGQGTDESITGMRTPQTRPIVEPSIDVAESPSARGRYQG